jgi:fructosamine-3-kinase
MVGFTREFFDEYHKVHRRSSPHYHQRQTLYELWHHLNVRPEIPQGKSHADEQHTLMFGGSYKSGALRMMKELNAWAEEQEPPKGQ